MIKSGRLKKGLKEADMSLAMSPADADTLIDVVTALESANHKAEADALYQRAMARYARLSADHPQSGPLHNLCAWAAARCHRDLDAALAHAKAAVQQLLDEIVFLVVHGGAPERGDVDNVIQERPIARFHKTGFASLFRQLSDALHRPVERALFPFIREGSAIHHVLHAVRAELLRRLGRTGEAAQAYGRAAELTGNSVERAHLERRRHDVGG